MRPNTWRTALHFGLSACVLALLLAPLLTYAERRGLFVNASKAQKNIAHSDLGIHFPNKLGSSFLVPIPEEMFNGDNKEKIVFALSRKGVDLAAVRQAYEDFVKRDPVITQWRDSARQKLILLKGERPRDGRKTLFAVNPRGQVLSYTLGSDGGIRYKEITKKLKRTPLNLGSAFYEALAKVKASRLPLFSDEAGEIAAAMKIPEALPFVIHMDEKNKAANFEVVDKIHGDEPFELVVGVASDLKNPNRPVPNILGVALALLPVEVKESEGKPSEQKPSGQPSTKPSAEPTARPTARPSATSTPAVTPRPRPTEAPTQEPTPSARPTLQPTVQPTIQPSSTPTAKPSLSATPTPTPTPQATSKPSSSPTATPSAVPTQNQPSPVNQTVWYVDNAAKGLNDGSSWTNAWKSFADIAWKTVKPGHTLYISGGSGSKIYKEELYVGASGVPDAPITIKVGQEPGHNGQVIISDSPRSGIFAKTRTYITVDGNYNGANHITIRNAATYGVHLDAHSKLFHLNIEDNGYVSKKGSGVLLNAFADHWEIAYSVIRRNYVYAITQSNEARPVGYGHNKVHHNEITDIAYDGLKGGLVNLDLYNNTIGRAFYGGRPDPHLDMLQTSNINKSLYLRVYNNHFFDFTNSVTYFEVAPNGTFADFMFYNNIVEKSTYGGSDQGIFVGRGAQAHIKDVLVAHNVFKNVDRFGVGLGGAPSILGKNIVVANNIFINTGSSKGTSVISVGSNTLDMANANVDSTIIDGNAAFAGPNGSTGIRFANETFSSGTDAAWLQKYPQWNKNVIGELGLDANHYPTNDSRLINKGVNLSHYADSAPGIDKDKNGIQRKSTGPWTIGAYESPLQAAPTPVPPTPTPKPTPTSTPISTPASTPTPGIFPAPLANNKTEPGEACDGTDLNGHTFATVAAGFRGGVLKCKPDRKGYDISGLIPGNIVKALSCSQVDVQDAINKAQDGDTVEVPAGVCTWSTPVIVGQPPTYPNKSILLKGAGIDKTTIIDNTKVFTSRIADSALNIKLTPGKPFRITGFTFDGSGSKDSSGPVRISGTAGTTLGRVDHSKFINLKDRGIMFYSAYGLIDNNTFIRRAETSGCCVTAVMVFGDRDNAWERPLSLGTENAVYMEDNEFDFSSPPNGAIDTYNGSRYVFRHNNVSGTWIGNHGFDSGGYRSGFSYEVYNNTFSNPQSNSPVWIFESRGGTGVIFNNVVSAIGGSYKSFARLRNYRSSDGYPAQYGGTYPWNGKPANGVCDGTNPHDGNTPGMQGYPCRDQIGRATGQALFPVYGWNNNFKGSIAGHLSRSGYGTTPPGIDRASLHIVEGRDFYNNVVAPEYVPYPHPHPVALIEPDPH